MKDYGAWHELKSKVEDRPTKFFKEAEVWWCAVGLNIGFEEDGKNDNYERPVLVFRKFNKNMFWGLPMTSVQREGKFYYSFSFKSRISTIMISQLRTLSSKRLVRHMGNISNDIFEEVEKRVISLIKETDPLRGPRVPYGNL